MSVPNDLMNEVLARLRAGSSFGVDAAMIRRSHRTAVPRDKAPAIHVIQGRLARQDNGGNGCYRDWRLSFTVRPMVRDDADFDAVDPLLREILARLEPTAEAPYSHSAVLTHGDIDPDQDIADGDALGLDVAFAFTFQTPDWTLDRAAPQS